MSLVTTILPPGLWGADIEDIGQVVMLHPVEEAAVATAGEKRRRDFALGRVCARAALAEAGLPDAVITRDERGAPVWPSGFVGSITHTHGYAAAVAARKADFMGIGVDAERVGGVTDALMPRLFDAGERGWLAGLDTEQRRVMATVLFSAKEASFKASATGQTLDFGSIHIEVQDNVLVARQPGFGELQGRFALGGDLALTAFWRR